MSPIQQMLLGAGGAGATKTYIDNIFSMDAWRGTNNTKTITNGIDLSGEGGMTWIKTRDVGTSGRYHAIADTVRGTNKLIRANDTDEQKTVSSSVQGFNSDGFELGGAAEVNWNTVGGTGDKYIGYTFREAPGFFDVVTYSGDNSSNRAISHSLGSAPGLILVKCTGPSPKEWHVWHRDQHGKVGVLNTNASFFSNASRFPTIPTSTNFYVGNDSALNDGSSTYVAYLFAGGESTAATAVSVDGFDGSRYMETDTSDSDFAFGTGDFTVEGWYKFNDDNQTEGLFSISPNGVGDLNSNASRAIAVLYDEDKFRMYAGNANGGSYVDSRTYKINEQLWYHIAYVRHSGTTSLYINGKKACSTSDTVNWATNNKVLIGGASYNFYYLDGKISNFRVVKGTAVYTSSFRPSTEPLTNITNTKLLCCQNSTPVVTTVIPSGVTMTRNTTNITESSDSPFDDPAGFVFGDAGDQNVIKTGSYLGTGSAGFEVNVGFEPSWIMVKSATSTENWEMYDSLRGLTVGGDAERLKANTSAAEDTNSNWFALTANGFIVNSTSGSANSNGQTYIFCAIRRSDGYVGQPVELGTNAFTMDVGNGSANGPAFDSNFAVDFTFSKQPASTGYWIVTARLFDEWLKFNGDQGSALSSYERYDFSKGVHQQYDSSNQAYMFKRHAGFDLCMYKGDSSDAQAVSHSLNKTPEMIWVANYESNGTDWCVYHKNLNGGTNPQNYRIALNYDSAESASNDWADVAPNASAFTVGDNDTNQNNETYIAMVFASVSGVSSVGSYSGSSSDKFVNLGFQPRLFICKARDSSGVSVKWNIFDSTRGISGASTKRMFLNTDGSQQTGSYVTSVSSTGITLAGGFSHSNSSGNNYIYYAHA